jgi:hypothetical protein
MAIKRVISFVKEWDPKLHPRGYGGMFVQALNQNKKKLTKVKPGGVVVDEEGTVSHITHKGPDGIIYGHFVDSDTGNVQPETIPLLDPENGGWDPNKYWQDPEVAILTNVPPGAKKDDLIDDVDQKPTPAVRLLAEAIQNKTGKREFDPKVAYNPAMGVTPQRSVESLEEGLRSEGVTDMTAGSAEELNRGVITSLLEDKEKADLVEQLKEENWHWFQKLKESWKQATDPIDPGTAKAIRALEKMDEYGNVNWNGAYQFLNHVENIDTASPTEWAYSRGLIDDATREHLDDIDSAAQLAAEEQELNRDGIYIRDTEIRAAAEQAVNVFVNKHSDSDETVELGEWEYEEAIDSAVDGKVDPGTTKEWLEGQGIPEQYLDELRSTIQEYEELAKQQWADRHLRAAEYDPAAPHTVEVTSAAELYDAIQAEIGKEEPDFQRFNPELDEQVRGRQAIVRQMVYDTAVAKWRLMDYSHPEGVYHIPRWDNLDFEPQDLDHVVGQLEGTRQEAYDVPIFYNSGVLKDGVIQVGIDKDSGQYYEHAKVMPQFDRDVTAKLKKAGAKQEPNGVDMSTYFPYEGSGDLYRGDMWELVDGEDKVLQPGERRQEIMDRFRAEIDRRMPDGEPGREETLKALRDADDEWKWSEEEHFQEAKVEALGGERNLEEFLGSRARDVATTAFQYLPGEPRFEEEWVALARTGRTKRKLIEYVPHKQMGDLKPDGQGLTTGAPTSQRGQLRLIGYTPEEADQRLRELELVGDLEPEIPYDAIMRGDRRHGQVMPLHSRYIRGEVDLPQPKERISHGVTGGVADMVRVLDSGGLLPISERIRQGVKVSSATSQKGDVRSGIDEGIFMRVGYSSWGSIVIAAKDDVLLRRDVILAPVDYGGGPSRYNSYLDWKRQMREKAGLDAPTLWTQPWEPEARDAHLKSISTQSSNEWNPVGGLPIEDWGMIYTGSKEQATEIRNKLRLLHKRGMIAEVPEVTTDKYRFQSHIKFESIGQPVEDSPSGSPPAINPALQSKDSPQVKFMKDVEDMATAKPLTVDDLVEAMENELAKTGAKPSGPPPVVNPAANPAMATLPVEAILVADEVADYLGDKAEALSTGKHGVAFVYGGHPMTITYTHNGVWKVTDEQTGIFQENAELGKLLNHAFIPAISQT